MEFGSLRREPRLNHLTLACILLQVPAIKLHHAESSTDPEVVWESDVVMRRLEEVYPETPMLPAQGSDARAAAEAMLVDAASLSAAGFQYASSLRNQSLTDSDRRQRRAAFEERLDHLESSICERGGPFLFGAQLGLVDAMYAPFLERWAVQLPLTSEFNLRPARGSPEPPRWPKIEAWFGAMASVPAYSSRVSGDAYSWSAAVATFQRMFSANGTLTDAQRHVASRADSAALLELKRAREEGMAKGVSSSAALTAAKVRLSQCRCPPSPADAIAQSWSAHLPTNLGDGTDASPQRGLSHPRPGCPVCNHAAQPLGGHAVHVSSAHPSILLSLACACRHTADTLCHADTAETHRQLGSRGRRRDVRASQVSDAPAAA